MVRASRRATKHALCVLSLVVAPRMAHAQQQPSPTAIAEARAAFERGVAATRREAWNEARAEFERSYAFVPAAMTLLNLATAESNSGHLVVAREHYRRFLDVATTPPARDFRSDVEASMTRLATRIPSARIHLTGTLDASDRIVLDEHTQLPPAALDGSLAVDPGDHVVSLRRGETTVGSTRFRANEGAAIEVQLVVANRAVPDARTVLATPSRPVTPHEQPARWYRSGWLWGAVGVAVAGGITAGIVVAATSGGGLAGNTDPPSGSVR